MTKTHIISVVVIIVVVQAQAHRALLQSVPNKKRILCMHMMDGHVPYKCKHLDAKFY
jgi:hypothetical protein